MGDGWTDCGLSLSNKGVAMVVRGEEIAIKSPEGKALSVYVPTLTCCGLVHDGKNKIQDTSGWTVGWPGSALAIR